MVTKPRESNTFKAISLILAKNHMVTKPDFKREYSSLSLILAKNHMVTKLSLTILSTS